jgi:hypothetical protein
MMLQVETHHVRYLVAYRRSIKSKKLWEKYFGKLSDAQAFYKLKEPTSWRIILQKKWVELHEETIEYRI